MEREKAEREKNIGDATMERHEENVREGETEGKGQSITDREKRQRETKER